jgi:transcriptional regulator with XRE-family HTH domain
LALFFDGAWFANRLASIGLDRADLALAMGISTADLALVWKDQREVSPSEVDCIAALLGEDPDVIASRCGISTRVAPQDMPSTYTGDTRRIAELEERVAVLEQTVALLLDQAVARTR